MAKVRFTKNELRRQRENLRRFTRFLPTLELKKKQLLAEIRSIQHALEELEAEIQRVDSEVAKWADVFAEDVDLQSLVKVSEVRTEQGNIAGIDIPLFKEVVFEDVEYDFFSTPLWIDKGIDVCKEQIARKAEAQIRKKQQAILREELRITIQRIKLFEEVKIPEARETIRVIQIFLGDLMTAEVVRGKIAKAKIEKKRAEAGSV
jgi:V/A-type H+-transporting ATPase subunit D